MTDDFVEIKDLRSHISDLRSQTCVFRNPGSGIRHRLGRGSVLGSEFRIRPSDGGLAGGHEIAEIILVREVGRIDGREHADLGVAGMEQFGAGLRDSVGAFDDDRKYGKARVDGDTESPFLEGKHLTVIAPCAFREYDQGISSLGGQLDALVDDGAGGATRLSVDFDDPDPAHCCADDRNLEELLLGEKAPIRWKGPEHQWDVECRQVVGHDDVSRGRISVFQSLGGHLDRRDAKDHARPPFEDPAEH